MAAALPLSTLLASSDFKIREAEIADTKVGIRAGIRM
jgi:hypothetical protein